MDLAVRAVGEVPAVEPAAGERDRGGGLGLAVVAARHRGPAEDESADHPLRDVRAGVVHDPDLVARQLAPGRDELEGRLVAGKGGVRAPLALEGLAGHAVHPRSPAHRGHGEPHRALGEAVGRRHRLGPEAAGREAAGEARERPRAHRLRAVEGGAPGGEVEALERLVGDAAGAQLVGEVRRRGEGRAPLVDRPEPPLGPGEERGGRQQRERQALVEAEEPRADEPHVVVERQPAHPDVGGTYLEAGPDRAEVGEEVVVGEEDPLGLAGAARRVLDEGRVGAVALRAGDGQARGGQLLGGHDVDERRHRGPQEARHGPGAGDRDEEAHAGVPEDRGLADRILLETVEADGRVDRHGDGAREQDPEEGAQEVEAGRQHEGDGVAARDAALAEAARDRRRLVAQPPVGDRLLAPVDEALRRARPARRARCGLPAQEDVDARGLEEGVTPERLVEGASRPRRCRRRRRGPPRARAGRAGRAPSPSSRARARLDAVSRPRQRSSRARPKARSRRATSSTRSRLPRPTSRSSEAPGETARSARAPPVSRARARTTSRTRSSTASDRGPGAPAASPVGHRRHSMGASGHAQTARARGGDREAPGKRKGAGAASRAPRSGKVRPYFAPRTPSLAALATTNFSRFRAGILIASPVCGLRPMRAL